MRVSKPLWLALLLTLVLSGCAGVGPAVQAAKAMVGGGSAPSLDVTVAKGDAKGEDSVSQNADTAIQVEAGSSTEVVTEGPVDTIINERGMGTFELMLLVLLAGWAIPSPGAMARGAARWLRAGASWLRERNS